MINNSPPAHLVNIPALLSRCNLVTDNLHARRLFFAHEIHQQCPDNRLHPPTEDNYRDVIISRVFKKRSEPFVQSNILDQSLDAGIKAGVQANRVEHLLEGVAKVPLEGEDVVVVRFTLVGAEAEVVGQEVVGVLLGYGAVEVGEEDELGGGCEGGEMGVRLGAHFDLGFRGLSGWLSEGYVRGRVEGYRLCMLGLIEVRAEG